MHASERLAQAVSETLGDHIRADEDFSASVWGALVFNEWRDRNGVEGILTWRGADATIGEIRGDDQSFYGEGQEGPPCPEIADAMASAGWTWSPPA